MTLSSSLLAPWGESYDELAGAVLADKSAPPILLLAAFLYQHGEQSTLRGLIADAIALDQKEAA